MHDTLFSHRLWTILGIRPQFAVLLCADLCTLYLASLVAYVVRLLLGPIDFHLYKELFSLLLLGPVFYCAFGTYQSIALPPHREVKQLFLSTSLIFLIILAVVFVTKSDVYSRLVLVGAWAISIAAVPLMRGFVRRRYAKSPWWGRPLVLCGQGPMVDDIWQSIANSPERGIYPVEKLAIATGDPCQAQTLAACAKKYYKPLILLIPASSSEAFSMPLIADASRVFSGVLVSPAYSPRDARLWLTPRDLGNMVGLLVRQNLLDKRRLRVKRLCDIILSILGSCITVPLGLCIGLWIRLDSKGPALYTQNRVGYDGETIKVYKFRTMVANADAVLQAYLDAHPDYAAEWQNDRKLKQDPRLTRVGRILRKTSLDELPQLWNVLIGNMSLVGPRPIVREEMKKYGPVFEEYCMVKPGITGLWQISGRNNTTYEERVRHDHYYVSNWSVWMDLWILARTIPVVIMGKGAY